MGPLVWGAGCQEWDEHPTRDTAAPVCNDATPWLDALGENAKLSHGAPQLVALTILRSKVFTLGPIYCPFSMVFYGGLELVFLVLVT